MYFLSIDPAAPLMVVSADVTPKCKSSGKWPKPQSTLGVKKYQHGLNTAPNGKEPWPIILAFAVMDLLLLHNTALVCAMLSTTSVPSSYTSSSSSSNHPPLTRFDSVTHTAQIAGPHVLLLCTHTPASTPAPYLYSELGHILRGSFVHAQCEDSTREGWAESRTEL